MNQKKTPKAATSCKPSRCRGRLGVSRFCSELIAGSGFLLRNRSLFLKCIQGALLALTCLLISNPGWSQIEGAVSLPSLSADQIVERMQLHDMRQAEALESYKALRHYKVEYRGFFKRITAEMDVEVNYSASSGKSFRIISESGSRVLCKRVLEQAVDSEKEAARSKGAAALTPSNYRFLLLGSEDLNGHPDYVLHVEPLTPGKFLYRGKIWVDANDFALAKIEVQPAKNPSFWITRTIIHNVYGQTGGFWLPVQNRSETKVRIGGTAVLTIDYGKYEVVPRQAQTVACESGETARVRIDHRFPEEPADRQGH